MGVIYLKNIYTIGYSGVKAEDFFNKLKDSKVNILVDIRLNNSSQLAGYAKKDNLRYFLKEICGIKYYEQKLLAPTKELLDDYKKKKINWEGYVSVFNELLTKRDIINKISDVLPFPLENICFLCSEKEHYNCHRSLVAEQLASQFNFKIINL